MVPLDFILVIFFFIRSNLYTQILNGNRFFMYFFFLFLYSYCDFFFPGEEHVICEQHHHYLDAHECAWRHCEDTLYSQTWRRDHGHNRVRTETAAAHWSREETSSRGRAWPLAGQWPWATGARASTLIAVRRSGRAHGAVLWRRRVFQLGRGQVQEIGPVNFFFLKNGIFLKLFRKLSFFKIVFGKIVIFEKQLGKNDIFEI